MKKTIVRIVAKLLGVSVWDENGVLCGAMDNSPTEKDSCSSQSLG
jgi:hypothetical protein